MSTVNARANSALGSALNNAGGAYSSQEKKLLDTLSGPDKMRLLTQIQLRNQQQAVGFILNTLAGMGMMGAPRGAGGFSSGAGGISSNDGWCGSGPRAGAAGATNIGTAPTSPTTVGNPYSTELSREQLSMLDMVKDPAQRARVEAQFRSQNEQEVVAFISNTMKKRNEIAMSIIGNMK